MSAHTLAGRSGPKVLLDGRETGGQQGRTRRNRLGRGAGQWSTNGQCSVSHPHSPDCSVFKCSQESRVGTLYSWRVDRDDGTTVRNLGFPGWCNGSGTASL